MFNSAYFSIYGLREVTQVDWICRVHYLSVYSDADFLQASIFTEDQYDFCKIILFIYMEIRGS